MAAITIGYKRGKTRIMLSFTNTTNEGRVARGLMLVCCGLVLNIKAVVVVYLRRAGGEEKFKDSIGASERGRGRACSFSAMETN